MRLATCVGCRANPLQYLLLKLVRLVDLEMLVAPLWTIILSEIKFRKHSHSAKQIFCCCRNEAFNSKIVF
jgi:hypothetical protein